MDIKIQIVVDGKVHSLDDEGMDQLLQACRVKKDFGGTEYKDREYGSVEVELGPEGKSKKYVLVVGNLEWAEAEKKFGVKNLQGVMRATESEANMTEFCRIALSRYQPNLTAKDVALLRDWRADGKPTLRDALDRALAFTKPTVFPDEAPDPKAVRALKAALLLAASPLESPTT